MAPLLALPLQLAQLALESRHAVAHAAAIDLELRLSRAATTDSTGEPRQRNVHALGQPRQPIAKLGQLDLEPAVPGARVLREQIEDELGAVDHPEIEAFAQVARLGGGEVLIEDHQVGVVLEGADHEILKPSRPDQELRIHPRPVLGHHLDDLHSRRARQFAKFADLHFHVVGAATRCYRDQDRPLALSDLAGSVLSREFFFPSADPLPKVEIESRGREGVEVLVGDSLGVGRPERCGVGQSGKAIRAGRHGDHRIEPQERQVGQVIEGERLVPDVGVYAAQTAEASATGAHSAPIRKLDGTGVADHDVGDVAAAVHQDAHLPPGLEREGGQLPRQFLGDEALGRQPAPREAFELAHLAGFETAGIAEDLDEESLDVWAGRRRGSAERIGAPRRSGEQIHRRSCGLDPTGGSARESGTAASLPLAPGRG